MARWTLKGDLVWPHPAEDGGGDTVVIEQGGACGATGLREPLGGQDAEREAGVDGVVGEPRGCGHAALDDGVEPDLLGVHRPGLDGAEGGTLVEVRDGDPVPGRLELIRKGTDPGRESLGVVEQDQLGHCGPTCRRARGSWTVVGTPVAASPIRP